MQMLSTLAGLTEIHALNRLGDGGPNVIATRAQDRRGSRSVHRVEAIPHGEAFHSLTTIYQGRQYTEMMRLDILTTDRVCYFPDWHPRADAHLGENPGPPSIGLEGFAGREGPIFTDAYHLGYEHCLR